VLAGCWKRVCDPSIREWHHRISWTLWYWRKLGHRCRGFFRSNLLGAMHLTPVTPSACGAASAALVAACLWKRLSLLRGYSLSSTGHH